MTGASILDPHLAKLFGAGGFIGRDAGAEGGCATQGRGRFQGKLCRGGRLGAAILVDLVIAPCPPTPAQLLAGLRALLQANGSFRARWLEAESSESLNRALKTKVPKAE